MTQDFRQAYFCMDMVQTPFLRLWHEASGCWCTLGEDAVAFEQCLFEVNTPPMCMNGSAWAHQRQHPGWASAWRALHHSRGRIPATDVQLLGSDCEEARAGPLSTVAPAPQALLRFGLGSVRKASVRSHCWAGCICHRPDSRELFGCC